MVKGAPKVAKEETKYAVNDIVLGKVRGFPSWPGMVVDPDTAPGIVQKERPGKKSNFYCVRFFPVGDYAWLVAKDISALKTSEIQTYISEPSKRNGDLLKGYQVALDPKAWETEIATKPYKNPEPEIPEEEDDEQDEDGKKKATKKRKRDEAPKPAKKPVAKKEPVKKKAPAKKSMKSNATVESEDDAAGENDAEGSRKTSPPAAKKKKKDEEEDSKYANDPEANKVKNLRHQLQKAFLNAKVELKPEEMDENDKLFRTIEEYDMNIGYLTFSKIGKVMRHVTGLSPEKVPRNDEFHFLARASALVDKWHAILKPENATNALGGALTVGNISVAPTNGASDMQVDTNGTDVPIDTSTVELTPAPAGAEPIDAPMADA